MNHYEEEIAALKHPLNARKGRRPTKKRGKRSSDTTKGLEMKYFILKPRAKTKDDHYAAASQSAMYHYADIIEEYNTELALNLRRWAGQETARMIRLT